MIEQQMIEKGVKIGLETHITLPTKSKLFCCCSNTSKKDETPNTRICPICLGHPGTKPYLNKSAVKIAIKLAIALKCNIAKKTYFSRKTYFYPDLAKDFQITQYEIPIAQKGSVILKTNNKEKKITIRRIHIEEDPAKIIYQKECSFLDYNRSGSPLIEIVTEPDFEDSTQARYYLQKLITMLEYLGIYNLDDETTIKTDANISLAGKNRVEVKNIGGVREVEKALKYEFIRQKNILAKNIIPQMETRGWLDKLGISKPLRLKETEEDYGYIFEPDLPHITIEKDEIEKLQQMVKLLDADGLFVHLNPIQEYLQPEGDRFRLLPIEIMERLLEKVDFPVLVKEVGQGMGPKSIEALMDLDLAGIEFGAFGGTNFAQMELYRSDELKQEILNPLSTVGHTAEEMVDYLNGLPYSIMHEKNIIISGGISNWLEGYYLIEKIKYPAVFGQASAFLKYAQGDYKQLSDYVLNLKKDFQTAVSLIDRGDVQDHIIRNPKDYVGALQKVPFKILKLYVHSVQSFFWNKVAEKVDAEQIPLISFDTEFKDKKIEKEYNELIKEECLDLGNFVIRQFNNLTPLGSYRKRIAEVSSLKIGNLEKDDLKEGRKKVKIEFILPKGSYATVYIKSLYT